MNFHYAIDPRLVLLPFHWCLKFINHLRYTWLNGRLTTRATVDVFINLLLVLLWIILSKVVLWIPNLIRPPIYVRLCMRLDEYVFSMHPYWMGSILSLICICAGGWLIYNKFYRLISVVLPNAIELTKIGHLTDVSSTSSSEMEHEIGFKLWMVFFRGGFWQPWGPISQKFQMRQGNHCMGILCGIALLGTHSDFAMALLISTARSNCLILVEFGTAKSHGSYNPFHFPQRSTSLYSSIW